MADKLVDVATKNLTPESFLDFYKDIRLGRSKLDTAQGEYRNARKRAKDGGVDMGALALMEQLARLEPEDAELRLKNLRRYMTWDGGGEQLDMFDAALEEEIEAPKAKAAERHAESKAEDTGYKHGLIGGDVKDCAFAPGTGLNQAWVRGWSRGDEARKAREGNDVAALKKASTRRGMPSKVAAQSADQPYAPADVVPAGSLSYVVPDQAAPR